MLIPAAKALGHRHCPIPMFSLKELPGSYEMREELITIISNEMPPLQQQHEQPDPELLHDMQQTPSGRALRQLRVRETFFP